MFLNRENIRLIIQTRQLAEANGYAFAQTNSRKDGRFLDACRVYESPDDLYRPHRAILQLKSPADFRRFLLMMEEAAAEAAAEATA